MGKHRAGDEPDQVRVPAQPGAPVEESSVVDLINRSLALRTREVDLNSLLHATTHDAALEAELDRIHDARQAHAARRGW